MIPAVLLGIFLLSLFCLFVLRKMNNNQKKKKKKKLEGKSVSQYSEAEETEFKLNGSTQNETGS